MRAEVVGVGTELLLGDIVNTNAAWIGRELAEAGWSCYRHTVVGDNVERIAAVLREAASRADAVIVTGGLGPTQDDVSREALCLATGRAMHRDAVIAAALRERFAALGREMPEMNLRQADVPEGARVIEPTFGTAPGLIVDDDGTVFALVPGVPREMVDMMQRAVLPDLRARGGAAIVSRIVRTAGIAESAVAQTLAPLWERLQGVTMAFLAGGGEVRVRLTSGAVDDGLDEAVSAVRDALGAAVVGLDDDTLEVVVLRLLRERGWTVAAAESLTGGALGARITAVPGSSDTFRGAVVSYATEVKRDVLRVDGALLEREGAVHPDVALQMAAGARDALGADVGIALTGVAGPGPQEGKPAGTVIAAVVSPAGQAVRELRAPGDRETVRQIAVSAALNLARLRLLGEG